MDPLPPINKVFALISQEENQRNVVVNSGDPVLFNVKHDMHKSSQNRFQKSKPICTHCGFHGHTIEKCYKLHDYPPGYKVKQRNPRNSNPNYLNSNQLSSNIVS